MVAEATARGACCFFNHLSELQAQIALQEGARHGLVTYAADFANASVHLLPRAGEWPLPQSLTHRRTGIKV